MGQRKIYQCLLFRDPLIARELAPALWAALQEVENLFSLGDKRAIFERTIICNFEGSLGIPIKQSAPPADLWRSARTKGHMVDQETLVEGVLEVFGPEEDEDGSLVLITDQEIKPPDGWRYIIWDPVDDGHSAVISVAPIDPAYWAVRDSERVATIKHRVRTAACCVTGELLGIRRCSNPHCYMYNAVDSVLTLDRMFYFGPEHRIPEMSNTTFASGSPEQVAPFDKNKRPGGPTYGESAIVFPGSDDVAGRGFQEVPNG